MPPVSGELGRARLPGLGSNSGLVSVLSSGFESPLANPHPVFPHRVIFQPPGSSPYICVSFFFPSRNILRGRVLWFGHVPQFLSASISSIQLLSDVLRSRAPGPRADHCPLPTFPDFQSFRNNRTGLLEPLLYGQVYF